MASNLKKKTEQWMQLERTTLEQRRMAQDFYDTELMQLIEKDYCRRNKSYVFEKTDYLIISVGTSYEPVVLNIRLLRPKKILFLYTDGSESTLEKIVAYCGLKLSAFERKKVDETDPLSVYREIKKIYLTWNRPEKIYIDFTGGTKAMSAATAMAGAAINVQLVYVGTDRYLTDFRKPEPGSEILLYIDNPIAVFGDLEIEKAMTLFSEHNYSGAKEKLNVLRSNIPDPALRQQLDFACLLAEAYEAWDGLDFVSASQKMNHLTISLRRDARAHHDFLLMDRRKELETQADILRSLSHIPEKIRDRHQQEILKDRELMANLMFSLYQNASIREQQDKYDMASLLMYRLLEMIEQRRLIQYGLYVSRMDYARLNFKKLESRGIPDLNALQTKMNTVRENVFGKAGNRLLPDQVSLLDGFMLLLALGDEICREVDGRDIDFIKRTRSMVYLRNNSIFAHGLGPVGKENYVKFRDFVIVVFKRYCRLEKIDFTKMASEVQFINPKDSDYYSGIGTGL